MLSKENRMGYFYAFKFYLRFDIFPLKTKTRRSEVYPNPQNPAKYLSLLKGRILYQRAHTSAEFYSILVLIVCKSLAPEMWHNSLFNAPFPFPE